MKSLLLNLDGTPLNFISPLRALDLVTKGKAEPVLVDDGPSAWSQSLTTPTKSYPSFATIRLLRKVHRTWPAPKFRKCVLFNRDGWKCQYCGVGLDWRSVTIDHVIPRSRGGSTSWKNCVASCKKCNLRKGPRTPHEAGMRLRKDPSDPNFQHFWETPEINRLSWHVDWRMFLLTA